MFRRTALAVTAGALALGGAALLVPSPADAASPDAVVAAADKGGHRLLTPEQRQVLRTAGHLSVTKQTRKHGTVTVLVQRGEVTSVSPTSISLTSKDGFSHSYVISDKTKVREQRRTVKLTDVIVGQRAMVIALQTKDGDVARRISCLRAAAPPAAER